MKEKLKRNSRKILVVGLSALCVCLVVGLYVYMNGMGGELDSSDVVDAPVESAPASVAEIALPTSESSAVSVAPVTTQEDASSSRARSPEEAVPPETTTVENEEDLTNPEQTPTYTPEQTQPSAQPNSPQPGDINANGEVWFPGFGWVQPSNEPNTQDTAPNAGTGDPIGDM